MEKLDDGVDEGELEEETRYSEGRPVGIVSSCTAHSAAKYHCLYPAGKFEVKVHPCCPMQSAGVGFASIDTRFEPDSQLSLKWPNTNLIDVMTVLENVHWIDLLTDAAQLVISLKKLIFVLFK